MGGRRRDDGPQPQPEAADIDVRHVQHPRRRGGGYVLDIGGRDAAQALDLAERFRCQVLSVDPVQANIDFGTEDIANHEYGHLVENKLGTINDIPALDAIFSRDMMGHVEDLEGALTECRRVLKPGGAMVIHDVFATPLLEPKESARLSANLAQAPGRLDGEFFQQNVEEAGFTIEVIDRVASEWLENLLEGEDGEKRLLRAARLNRDKGPVRRGDERPVVPRGPGQQPLDDLPHDRQARGSRVRDSRVARSCRDPTIQSAQPHRRVVRRQLIEAIGALRRP